MIIDGLWNMIIRPDGTKDPIKYIFHKVIKDRMREVIMQDPDATGASLNLLEGLEIDPRLITHEETDKYIVNEVFFSSMIDNYNREWKKYKPGIMERKYKDFFINFMFSLYRNDSEYLCKIGAMGSFAAMNKEEYADPNGNHLKFLESMYSFWKDGIKDVDGSVIQPGEGRDRVKPWIDWGFRFIINKYKKGVPFYVNSVNFALRYFYINAEKWQTIPAFYPENWYGNGKGTVAIELYGGNF